MKKYELLIFDLDDTLINNNKNVQYAFEKMLDYIEVGGGNIYLMIGKSLINSFG